MTQSIISYFGNIDSELLLWLNSFHSDFWDPVMMSLTNKWLWIALSVLLVFFVFRHGGAKRGFLCLVCLGVALALSDQICAALLRPAIERMRPSNLSNPISDYVHVVDGYRAGRYGFPSCHAATTMAVAIFLALYFKRRAVTLGLVAWSMFLCYTRVYLGVHYPGDILCGLVIGSSLALMSFYIYSKLIQVKFHNIFIPFARRRLANG